MKKTLDAYGLRGGDSHADDQRYLAMIQDQTELVSRFLPDGTLTFVNDAYCRFFGESSLPDTFCRYPDGR